MKKFLSPALLGSFDGLVSVLGVIFALYAKGTSKDIVLAAVGLAVAATISMGGGEFLAENDSSVAQAIAMGVATLVGTLIPAIPFIFLGKTAGLIVSAILTLVFSYFIARAREKGLKGYIQTYGILFFAAGMTILVTSLTGATG